MEVVGYVGVKATLANADRYSYGLPHDHWFLERRDDSDEWRCVRFEDCPAYGYFTEVPLDDLTINPDWTAPAPPTVDPDFLSGYLRGDQERRQRLRDAYYHGTSQDIPPMDGEYAQRLRNVLRNDWSPFGSDPQTYHTWDEENEYPD